MASWSAVQVPSTPKTQAPVLPEPGLLHGRLRSALPLAVGELDAQPTDRLAPVVGLALFDARFCVSAR